MFGFFAKHTGTLVVGILLAAAVIFAVIKLWKDRKKGNTCGGNCMGCSSSDVCKKKDR